MGVRAVFGCYGIPTDEAFFNCGHCMTTLIRPYEGQAVKSKQNRIELIGDMIQIGVTQIGNFPEFKKKDIGYKVNKK